MGAAGIESREVVAAEHHDGGTGIDGGAQLVDHLERVGVGTGGEPDREVDARCTCGQLARTR